MGQPTDEGQQHGEEQPEQPTDEGQQHGEEQPTDEGQQHGKEQPEQPTGEGQQHGKEQPEQLTDEGQQHGEEQPEQPTDEVQQHGKEKPEQLTDEGQQGQQGSQQSSQPRGQEQLTYEVERKIRNRDCRIEVISNTAVNDKRIINCIFDDLISDLVNEENEKEDKIERKYYIGIICREGSLYNF